MPSERMIAPPIGGPTHFNRVECIALLGKTKIPYSLRQGIGFMEGVFGNLGRTFPVELATPGLLQMASPFGFSPWSNVL